jgi:hypothetical protein
MKWSIACGLGLVGWTLAACGSHPAPDGNDAGSDVDAAGSGDTSTGGNAGKSGTGGAAGVAGNGGVSTGTGGASGDGNGGTGGVSGTGGAGAGQGGNGGVVDAGGSGGKGDATGGAAGSGGSTAGDGGGPRDGSAGRGGSRIDGAGGPCVVDQDCPPLPCLSSPCPESVCAMGEGAHQCVMRQHPPIAPCPPGDAGPFCCTSDAQCTDQPRGSCIPYSYSPWCTQSLHIPPPLPGNRCVYDACAADSDCSTEPNGFCSPDFPRHCVYGPCGTNADCNRRAGGKCVLARVCEWGSYRDAFCRYADDPCSTNADCGFSDAGTSMFCVARDDGHGTYCKDGGRPPP